MGYLAKWKRIRQDAGIVNMWRNIGSQKKNLDHQLDVTNMNLFKGIFDLCLALPALMLIDGIKRWSKYLNEDDPVGAFLWTLLIVFVLLLIILLANGYRY